MAIDMWSLGCILAELYTGYPIFPGENEQEQLSCIMEVLGLPDKELIARSSRKRLFFGMQLLPPPSICSLAKGIYLDSTGAPRPVVNSRGRRRRPGTKTLAQVLRCDEEPFVDFVAKCLHWDPEKRLKPQNAMRHPFITAGRKPKTTLTSSTSRSLLGSASSSLSSRSKTLTETPKKTQISAPTPLAARVSSVRAPTVSVPATPIGTPGTQNYGSGSSGSHRSTYRTAGTGSVSYHHSSRTLANGYAVSVRQP